VFTTAAIVAGLLAAVVIGLSKTAIPGGGMLATPLLATVVSGRLIAGLTLPLLLVADLFAVRWYGRHARHDVLRPLVGPVLVGFAAGTAFYVGVGSGGRTFDIALGAMILVLVLLQLQRMITNRPPAHATPATARAVGVSGGFTTFVSNASGPVLNTYLSGIGLEKQTLLGTNAWFFFSVNLAKVPVYLAIMKFAGGRAFFTADSLRFDLLVVPAIFVGVFGGKWLAPRIPQRSFSYAVVTLAGLASLKLLLGL
jgi:uncharacterized protein